MPEPEVVATESASMETEESVQSIGEEKGAGLDSKDSSSSSSSSSDQVTPADVEPKKEKRDVSGPR